MNWREYERHPISARYPDIKGQAFEDFRDNMSKRKIRGRAITLYEGKILDGWQLYRAALELDIEPRFVVLREGEDPEAYVEQANEHRRHESAEAMCARADKRRERVAAMRREGKSQRAIAEEEEISESQVRRDLEAASGAPGGAPEPETGKTTGQDGKQYPPKKQKILCVHCQTLVRKSLALPARCEECSELNRTKRAGQTTRPPRPRKNGQILPDYKKEFEAHYGPLVCIFDVMRKELNCQETGPFQGALRCASGLLENFKEANKLVLGKRK